METIRSVNTNSLESYIVMHSGHHEDRISKQITVTGGRVINCVQGDLIAWSQSHESLLCNCRLVDWTAVSDLQQGAWGSLPGSRTSGALIEQVNKCCLAFHQHNGYHKLLTSRKEITDNVKSW